MIFQGEHNRASTMTKLKWWTTDNRIHSSHRRTHSENMQSEEFAL